MQINRPRYSTTILWMLRLATCIVVALCIIQQFLSKPLATFFKPSEKQYSYRSGKISNKINYISFDTVCVWGGIDFSSISQDQYATICNSDNFSDIEHIIKTASPGGCFDDSMIRLRVMFPNDVVYVDLNGNVLCCHQQYHLEKHQFQRLYNIMKRVDKESPSSYSRKTDSLLK